MYFIIAESDACALSNIMFGKGEKADIFTMCSIVSKVIEFYKESSTAPEELWK